MNSPTLILILLAVAVVSAIVSRAYFLRRIYRKLNYMLDALEDKETNFHFSEEKFWYRRFKPDIESDSCFVRPGASGNSRTGKVLWLDAGAGTYWNCCGGVV